MPREVPFLRKVYKTIAKQTYTTTLYITIYTILYTYYHEDT